MESSWPMLFAAVVGFTHAFEADHLVAVSNIVTKRSNIWLAMKDGVYWGIGHTSTIVLIGLLVIVGRASFFDNYFGWFEAGVGIMLVLLGLYRLYEFNKHRTHSHPLVDSSHNHHLAYGVGLIHGLAGSGAMILLVMTEIASARASMIYLIIFGIGSVIGMFVAAGIFSMPFTQRFTRHKRVQRSLILLSSVICIIYGAYVMIKNLT